MIVVVSPAKKLDFSSNDVKQNWSVPDYLDQSAELIKTARQLTRSQIGNLMNVSDKLADLNYQRYRDFEEPFTLSNARQAALAFKGDTYVGLDAETLSIEDLEFAQNHFRILSGLYGILRPLDLMQAYRLELCCRLHSSKGKNLFDFCMHCMIEFCKTSLVIMCCSMIEHFYITC